MSVGLVTTSALTFEGGLRLDSGSTLRPVTVAYETYGELNAGRDNAILVCHALSGGAHAAGWHANARKPGWWDVMIGPGRAFDTRRYCVISSNVLGSCYGTTGPASVDPRTGRPYGSRFPLVSITDIVNLQRALLDRLGVGRLLAVAGGSMGGMQALQWAVSFPDDARGVIAIATTACHSAQQIAFDEVARRAVIGDPGWNGGDYYDGAGPVAGLAVARMLGHITYLSDQGMADKFGRRRSTHDGGTVFEVERYLRHQGESFVRRFDANSLILLTRAMDAFDLGDGHLSLAHAFARSRARFLLLSFSSDWLYPPRQLEQVAEAIRRRGRPPASVRAAPIESQDGEVAYHEIPSSYGHDAFLLEHARQTPLIAAFLEQLGTSAAGRGHRASRTGWFCKEGGRTTRCCSRSSG